MLSCVHLLHSLQLKGEKKRGSIFSSLRIKKKEKALKGTKQRRITGPIDRNGIKKIYIKSTHSSFSIDLWSSLLKNTCLNVAKTLI